MARAEMRLLERVVIVTGSLAAHEQTTLSVKVPGRIETIAVDLGSVVEKGDLIAQLEQIDYDLRQKQAAAALAQARAALGLPLEGTDDTINTDETSTVRQAKAVFEEAKKNRDRVLNLTQEGISSKSELDTVEAAFTVALNRYDAAVDEARTRFAVLNQRRIEFEIAKQALADTKISAPFDGAIQERTASVGEYVQAGSPVATLVRNDPLRLRLEVPERQSIHVRGGQTVRLSVEGDTNNYAGAISRLSPALTEDNRMLVVEADVPQRGILRPGLFVRAEIVTSAHDAGITIPPAALVTFAGLEKVFVVVDGKAAERNVVTGRANSEWIEIKSGVKPGDLVVLDPGNLRAGQRVSISAERQATLTTQAEPPESAHAASR
ncbi:MAG: efflux RND transporter periplasmic adaptor subunit [Verrucomicrobia subdivision 3 bacterium]|nr:efflux RND transporter periplasmic adaptor subunit [Limisphaerales bacterium]